MGLLAEAASQPSQWQGLIMIVLLLVFSYFMIIRPEQKRRKKLEAIRSQLHIGDKVVAMGIVGIVESIKETTLIITMVDGNKIEMLKGAISEVIPSNSTSGSEVTP